MKEIENLSPVEFCRKTGQENQIKNGHTTRTKNRFLSKFNQDCSVLDRLGFEVTIQPKKPAN